MGSLADSNKIRAFVCNITKGKPGSRNVVVLLEKEVGDLQYEYSRIVETERNVALHPIVGKILQNVGAQEGKLIATGGSLDRFNGVGKNGLGYIILGEIRNPDGVCLGYRIANYDGNVTKKRCQDVLALCKGYKDMNSVIFQNAQYVSTGEFIRSYPEQPFKVDIIDIANKYSKPAEIVKKKTELTQKEKLQKMFTDQQLAELYKAKKNNVDIRVIWNNKLSPKQMRLIWVAESKGLKARMFAKPEYSTDNMEYLIAEMETGEDITFLLNPDYSKEQMFQITLGLIYGVQVSKYADPKNSVNEMIKIREALELKESVWGNSHVRVGSLNNY